MTANHQSLEPVTLEGDGVRLQPLERSHGDGLLKAAADPQIWDFMPMAVQDERSLKRFLDDALARAAGGTELPFTIFQKPDDTIVGSTRLLTLPMPFTGLEIGWTWHSPSVWRTGVNTECKYLLLRHAFEDLGAIRVQLKTDARNTRSQNAIERLGAKREGVLRRHQLNYSGYIRDSVYFSITDDEWPAVKQRLEGFLAG
jgi:N-acetyltransferase